VSVISDGSFIGTSSKPRPRIVVACSASISKESGRRVVYATASSRSGRSPTGTMICGLIIRNLRVEERLAGLDLSVGRLAIGVATPR